MILRRFMHRTKKDEGRAEEIDSHLAHEQDAHAARGLSHQEARRQPHLRFGNPRGTRERVWRYRSFPWVEEGWRDLRFAVRSLARIPEFTSIALLASWPASYLVSKPGIRSLSSLRRCFSAQLLSSPFGFRRREQLVSIR